MNFEKDTYGQEKETKPKSFDAIAQELIANKELSELDGPQRANVIVDRFIGSVVRHGEVKGSKISYSPADILEGMDYVSIAGVDGLSEITKTEGLRSAVRDLSLDADVAKLFGQMSGRLGQDEEGKYTLTSSAQIEGYLLAGGEKNSITSPVGGVDMHGESWIPVIVEHTQRMAENPHMDWMTNSQAYDLVGSSAPLIKNTGRDWLMATSSARKAGVDIELLGRSAEKVQRRVKDGHDLGILALFLATTGKIGQYKKDLDRRSGY